MKHISLLILLVLPLCSNLLHAEEIPEDVATRVYQANINALMVFTVDF